MAKMNLNQYKVLVLNRSWYPIAIISLERAICLVVGENDLGPKAKIIDPLQDFRAFTWEDWSALKTLDTEPAIHSARQSYRVPQVILLSRYNKLPNHRAHFSRRTIFYRDKHQCQYCGHYPGTKELTIDHVVPRSQGGTTTWENCVSACVECNCFKANRTPEQANMKLFTIPKKPKATLHYGNYKCKSWEAILGEAYWMTELENDNDE